MIEDLFIAIFMVVGCILIGDNIYRDRILNDKMNLKSKVVFGSLCSVMALIFMFFNIELTKELIVDLRFIAYIIAFFVGGMVPAIVAGIISLLGRFIIGGAELGFFISIIRLFLYLGSFYLIKRLIKSKRVQLLSMYISSYIIYAGFLLVVMKQVPNFQTIYMKFTIAIIGAYIIVSFVLYYVTRNREIYKKYKQEAVMDFLTGLNNYRSFSYLYNHLLKRVKENRNKKNEKLAAITLDIDNFKLINDTYGHAVGDQVLKMVGETINKSTNFFDVSGRIGGEEFCIVLLDYDIEHAYEFAEQIRKKIEVSQVQLPDDQIIQVTVSIGLSTYPDCVNDSGMLLVKADEALYLSKRTGKNKTSIYCVKS